VTTVFDPDEFVQRCLSCLTAADPVGLAADAMASALADSDGVQRTFGEGAFNVLYWSPQMLIFQGTGHPGVWSRIHDHKMWAVIGVFRGVERNEFFERGDNRLRRTSELDIHAGKPEVLDPDVIHRSGNPEAEPNGWLNVYGGDLIHAIRTQWDDDGTNERPYQSGRRPQYVLQRWLDAQQASGMAATSS
jgi:predicted metal-dependent enzyme (double-stranded beta helix superfamily)